MTGFKQFRIGDRVVDDRDPRHVARVRAVLELGTVIRIEFEGSGHLEDIDAKSAGRLVKVPADYGA